MMFKFILFFVFLFLFIICDFFVFSVVLFYFLILEFFYNFFNKLKIDIEIIKVFWCVFLVILEVLVMERG